jgi:hypothetical protein
VKTAPVLFHIAHHLSSSVLLSHLAFVFSPALTGRTHSAKARDAHLQRQKVANKKWQKGLCCSPGPGCSTSGSPGLGQVPRGLARRPSTHFLRPRWQPAAVEQAQMERELVAAAGHCRTHSERVREESSKVLNRNPKPQC